MPSVPFCNLSDAFGSEWERKQNSEKEKTFADAFSCNSRNNQFQNEIAKNQFKSSVNPLNTQQVPQTIQQINTNEMPFAAVSVGNNQCPAGSSGPVGSAAPVSSLVSPRSNSLSGQGLMDIQAPMVPAYANQYYVPLQNYPQEYRVPQHVQYYYNHQIPMLNKWPYSYPIGYPTGSVGSMSSENFTNTYNNSYPTGSYGSFNNYGSLVKELFDKTDQTNKLITVLIVILVLLFVLQLVEVLKEK
jgi:hypothetical protein